MIISVKQRIAKQAQMLTTIERGADPIVQAFVKAFNGKAQAALRAGKKVTVSAAEQSNVVTTLADLMIEAYVRRYKFESKAINLDFSKDVKRIALEFDLDLGALENSFSGFAKSRVKDALGSVTDRLNTSLADITGKQLPTKQAVRELNTRLDEMGLTAKHPGIVESLVRTHAQIAFNAAQYQLDQDDPDDTIWGYTYATVGDDRVRDEHAVMDGVTREKDDPIWDDWWPPNGWNCRCQLISITKPQKQTRVPVGVAPDEGFDFNPGQLLEED